MSKFDDSPIPPWTSFDYEEVRTTDIELSVLHPWLGVLNSPHTWRAPKKRNITEWATTLPPINSPTATFFQTNIVPAVVRWLADKCPTPYPHILGVADGTVLLTDTTAASCTRTLFSSISPISLDRLKHLALLLGDTVLYYGLCLLCSTHQLSLDSHAAPHVFARLPATHPLVEYQKPTCIDPWKLILGLCNRHLTATCTFCQKPYALVDITSETMTLWEPFQRCTKCASLSLTKITPTTRSYKQLRTLMKRRHRQKGRVNV